jgi:hypothetical protein
VDYFSVFRLGDEVLDVAQLLNPVFTVAFGQQTGLASDSAARLL